MFLDRYTRGKDTATLLADDPISKEDNCSFFIDPQGTYRRIPDLRFPRTEGYLANGVSVSFMSEGTDLGSGQRVYLDNLSLDESDESCPTVFEGHHLFERRLFLSRAVANDSERLASKVNERLAYSIASKSKPGEDHYCEVEDVQVIDSDPKWVNRGLNLLRDLEFCTSLLFLGPFAERRKPIDVVAVQVKGMMLESIPPRF